LQRFWFGKQRDLHQLAVDGVQNTFIARRDEHPASRAEHVETPDIGCSPDVVEHD
jgi:hypothetical protein